MPFNKQKYRITDVEMKELSSETIHELDVLLRKVAEAPNISVSVGMEPKTLDTVVTIGKRSPVNA